jgi:type II secretory pathway pseudopilin PulG
MLVRKPDDEGFGLVEVVIAFFLLAIIAVAILPALYNGLTYSAQQSSVATATRQLNSIVEQVRQAPSCAGPTGIAWARASQTFTDGRGTTFTTSDTTNTGCSSGAVPLTLTAVQNGRTLATVSALVFVP